MGLYMVLYPPGCVAALAAKAAMAGTGCSSAFQQKALPFNHQPSISLAWHRTRQLGLILYSFRNVSNLFLEAKSTSHASLTTLPTNADEQVLSVDVVLV